MKYTVSIILIVLLLMAGHSAEAKNYGYKLFKDWSAEVVGKDNLDSVKLETINKSGKYLVLFFRKGKNSSMGIGGKWSADDIPEIKLNCEYRIDNNKAYNTHVLGMAQDGVFMLGMGYFPGVPLVKEMAYGNTINFKMYGEDFPPLTLNFSLRGFQDAFMHGLKLHNEIFGE